MKLNDLILAAAMVTPLVLVGCDTNDGPMEEAGEEVDSAIERAGENIEDAGDKIRDKTDN